MKILRFRATKVHGIYNFNLYFHEDISFLIGINGSGKTTVLRLIQAALTLDLVTLFSIGFRTACVTLHVDGKDRQILLNNDGKKLNVNIDGAQAEVKIPIPDNEERSIYSKSGRFEDYLEDLRLRFISEAGPEIQQFLKIPRPLFLGLERRAGRYDDEASYLDEEEDAHVFRPGRRTQRSIVDGLENCQRLLERTYRQYRRVSDGSNRQLVNVIFESTFDYIEFEPGIFSDESRESLMFDDLINRREEIEAIAANLGGGRSAKKKIDEFFSKINDVVYSENNNDKKKIIEIILNRAQLQRIKKMLAEMDKQKKRAEKHYAPIALFLECLNLFFEDSKKLASVDSLGRLNITQNEQDINLSWLSSGEKQLIILLAHARLARANEGIIIVDEPELSLHLKWQEMLIDNILSPGNNTQFIFATHSPEIVGYKKSNCIQVD